MRKIELLAPAKNADTGIEAILHGADAVYIGGPGFGARTAASNSIANIQRLCDFAHIYGAKVYVTLNTILYDDELADVEALVAELYSIGVDALITQDLALLSLDIPPIALHASTQMDNCTPERAQFLEAAGYSQIVLARELSVEQIRHVHAATSLPLEAFVHGALCVSYSGRCYASEYCFGRSANRGRCAQFCRLAFDLVDNDGHTIAADRHLLSLRDMNRSASLEEMMDAGVSSFKIEGRLKDTGYVKNVTAFYRQEIDKIIAQRPAEFQRSSRGVTHLKFEPSLTKSFNRGFTEYLLHTRTADLWNFSTPKSMGEYVGTVRRVGKRSLEIAANHTLNNGDGLAFVNALGKLEGFRVNKVEGREIIPLKMPSLTVGTKLYRNEDRMWEGMLAKPTAERIIPIGIALRETRDGYELSSYLTSSHTTCEHLLATCSFAAELLTAVKPQRDNIMRNLSKFGGTPFDAVSIEIETNGERFIPASLLSEMRRELVAETIAALQRQHKEQRDKRRVDSLKHLKAESLPFTANTANGAAERWLRSKGVKNIEPAFEIKQPVAGALMTCRHCLRYAFGQCPKETNHRPRWNEPVSLRLPDGRSFLLRFDCTMCEMQVMMPKSP